MLNFSATDHALTNDTTPNSSNLVIVCINSLDLTDTPFILPPDYTVDPQLLIDDDNVDNSSQCAYGYTIPVAINKVKLLEKYGFVYTYAPEVWLNDEEWFPSNVTFHTQHTHPQNVNKDLWTFANEKISEPSSISEFFHGQKPNETGYGPEVITAIFPIAPYK